MATLANDSTSTFSFRHGVPPLFYLLPGRISQPKKKNSKVMPQKPNSQNSNRKVGSKTTTRHNRFPYHEVTIRPIDVRFKKQMEP